MAIALMTSPALPDAVPHLAGPVVLTVTGLDPIDYPGGQATFDVPALQALGEITITTSSIWTQGKHSFSGTPLSALLRHLKVKDGKLSLHAINDYALEMPSDAVADDAPILAYDMDGAPMPVRDKGPIWVIYPFDDNSEYRSDTIFARSVWQLDRIDVLR